MNCPRLLLLITLSSILNPSMCQLGELITIFTSFEDYLIDQATKFESSSTNNDTQAPVIEKLPEPVILQNEPLENTHIKCLDLKLDHSAIQNIPRKSVKDVSGIGFQYDSGAAWSVICLNTQYGDIPGKRDNRGGVYFPWGGKEYRCDDWIANHGQLFFHTSPLPCDCKPHGYQTNDGNKYFNSVVVSKHGMIPGKALLDLSMAWYSYAGAEVFVRENFYIIC